MKKIFFLTFSFIILSSGYVFPQDAVIREGENLSLDRCVEIALKYHPDRLYYNFSASAKEALWEQAKKEYYPRVDLSSTGYTRYNKIYKNDDDVYTTITPNRNSYAAGVTLTQKIYDFGKREATVATSRYYYESALADIDDNTRTVINAVREAYYELLRTKRERAVNEEKVEKYRLHSEKARLFYQAGTKSRYDVTKAEVDLSNAKLDLLQSENDLQLAVVSLNNAMGIFEAPVYDLVDNLEYRKAGINLEEALTQAYERRPDLRSLTQQLEAARQALEAARREYYPSINGTAGYTTDGSEYPLSSGWNVGINLSLNLFEGFATKNKVAEKNAEIKKIQAKIEAQKLQINMEVRKAWLNMAKASQSITDTELQVRQATENLELANLKYEAGLNTPLEVTDATVSYGDAKLKHIKSLYEYKKGEANLEKAIGR
ncbi:MAG: Outer membrane protein TolC precursor [Smithella sp. PtaU1.Bin162]|nr:MAG: Outer membrane protein TolC precursor [Smithella sp. PtaU1.Bin162]